MHCSFPHEDQNWPSTWYRKGKLAQWSWNFLQTLHKICWPNYQKYWTDFATYGLKVNSAWWALADDRKYVLFLCNCFNKWTSLLYKLHKFWSWPDETWHVRIRNWSSPDLQNSNFLPWENAHKITDFLFFLSVRVKTQVLFSVWWKICVWLQKMKSKCFHNL